MLCLVSPFFSPELTFVVSVQTKQACWRFILFLTKKYTSADIVLTVGKWAPTSLLMGLRPMKCLEIGWFLKNVAHIASCYIDVTLLASSV